MKSRRITGLVATTAALAFATAAQARIGEVTSGDSPVAGLDSHLGANSISGGRGSMGRGMHNGGHRWGNRIGGRWWAGVRAPGGWGAYRRPVSGFVLPSYWMNRNFYLPNYSLYGLYQPQQGHVWSRYYDDAVLFDQRGRVVDSRRGIDWASYEGGYDDGYTDGYAAGQDSGYDDCDCYDLYQDSALLKGDAVTAGASYDGQWTGGYRDPEGRVYEGEWQGRYVGEDGRDYYTEYEGRWEGEGRSYDRHGNVIATGSPLASTEYADGYGNGPDYDPAWDRSHRPPRDAGSAERRVAPGREDDGLGGALIGGVAGGVAGNLIAGRGNRTAGTLIGAGVGAIAGAVIDKEEDRGRRGAEGQPSATYGYARAPQGAAPRGPNYGAYAHRQKHVQTQGAAGGQSYAYPYAGGYYYAYPGYYYTAPQTMTVIVQPGGQTVTTKTTVVEEEYYESGGKYVKRRRVGPDKRILRK